MEDYDLYDVLGEIGYRQAPKTRSERELDAFKYKNSAWLEFYGKRLNSGRQRQSPPSSPKVALTNLESKHILQTPEIIRVLVGCPLFVK